MMGIRWSRIALLSGLLPLLTACSFEQAKMRVGILVLIPALVVIVVFWLLNRRGGEEPWEEDHYPDADKDDDHEDHHLM